MKRSAGKVIKDGLKLAVQDLKNIWIAIVVFGAYFLVGRKFLYSLCPCIVLTGFPCPGCGLTRATFSILQGHFAEAWYLHPFSYVILLFVLIFAVRRYILLKETKSMMKWLAVIIIGMIVFYVYRMVKFFPGESPMSYYYGSVGYHILEILRNGF